MAKRVLLIGHCGPDVSYLKMAVSKAAPGTEFETAYDDADWRKALAGNAPGVALVLVNRALEPGFDFPTGIELIGAMTREFPGVKSMLVSNYADAQASAVAAGAIPGFGKREIGSPRVTELLRPLLA